MNILKRMAPYVIICATVLGLSSDAWPGDGIAAITTPSADVTLSFIQPGRIARVLVKEGDVVKAGQVLVQQDDDAEQAQLAIIKARSKDITQIEASKANLAQKQVYLKKLRWAAKRGSATELEIEEAKLGVKIAEFALKEARFERKQHQGKYTEASIRIDQMSLKSPIEGRVEKVDVEVGESIDVLTNAVRIVRTDPLWIDVHVPVDKGNHLKIDQQATIVFPGSEQEPLEGKLIFVSTVADAASSTLRVRVEFTNKSNRPAGEHVSVSFSAPEV